MPPHSAPSDVGHLAQMTASLRTPMVLLSDLHDTFGTPFLLAISNTVSSLLSAIQVSYFIYKHELPSLPQFCTDSEEQQA